MKKGVLLGISAVVLVMLAFAVPSLAAQGSAMAESLHSLVGRITVTDVPETATVDGQLKEPEEEAAKAPDEEQPKEEKQGNNNKKPVISQSNPDITIAFLKKSVFNDKGNINIPLKITYNTEAVQPQESKEVKGPKDKKQIPFTLSFRYEIKKSGATGSSALASTKDTQDLIVKHFNKVGDNAYKANILLKLGKVGEMEGFGPGEYTLSFFLTQNGGTTALDIPAGNITFIIRDHKLHMKDQEGPHKGPKVKADHGKKHGEMSFAKGKKK